MKKVVVMGASGFLGGHLCIEYAKMGYRVIAVTHTPGVVTEAIAKHAQIRMCDWDGLANMYHLADLVVDCSIHSSRYINDGNRSVGKAQLKYPVPESENVVALSSTIMLCENKNVSTLIGDEYVRSLYNKEKSHLDIGNHVLRLPVMTIEGHALGKEQLIKSNRMCLDLGLLRTKAHEQFIATEHRDSVRDYMPVSHLTDMIERSLRHMVNYACTRKPKTLQQQIEHLVDNHIVDKDPLFINNVVYDDSMKMSNHYCYVDYLPNVFGE